MATNPAREARTAKVPTTMQALSSTAVSTLTDALNAVLADTFGLYLKTKNFHWHVSGPHFRDYHLLFDEQASQVLATTEPARGLDRRGGKTRMVPRRGEPRATALNRGAK